MVTVDLITGFLGSGKTTFIHGYLHYLQKQNLKIMIIENEFGDVSVDSHLLAEEDCSVADLTGLCMCCVGKAAFIRLLERCARSGCDRIIVEPSGIYDVDEFFEVMSLPQIAAVCEIGAILTIADPEATAQLTQEAGYLLFAQMLASGTVILSRTQCFEEAQIETAVTELNRLMAAHGCEAGILGEVAVKPWTSWTDRDYAAVEDSGYFRIVHDRETFDHQETFASEVFRGHFTDREDLMKRIETLFASEACGRVYRLKGFVYSDTERYEVNCTSGSRHVRLTGYHVNREEDVLVTIGQRLNIREIKAIFAG